MTELRQGHRRRESPWGSPDSGPSTRHGPTRTLGLAILVLALTPVYRILRQPETGRFGGGGVLRGDTGLDAAWWGILTAVVLGGALAYLLPTQRAREKVAGWGRALAGVPIVAFATALAALATMLAALAGLGLFKGFPTLVDGMVALLQSRMLAAGFAALPLPEPAAAWMIPNTILVSQGWISQYPPFPAALLAFGRRLEALWLVQPLLVGAAVLFTALLAERILPRQEAVVRFGGVLLVSSPFLILIGGGYLSHVPAVAFASLTLYATVRARDGNWAWAILVGLGSGATVASRPWLGLVLCVGLPVALWLLESQRGKGLRWVGSRLAGAVTGGIPFAVAFGWYNRYFFGHALRLGYSVAFGPAHDLGFHRDPWGNLYGPLEALGFTGLDLLSLGLYLLETPLPAVGLVGAYLLLHPRRVPGRSLLLAWALLPVLANVLYWHHGSHLGPRMLYEAAPAWILLTGLAAVSLARGSSTVGWNGNPREGSGTGGNRRRARARERLRLSNVLFWALAVSFLASVVLVPLRVRSYTWPAETLARITPPALPDGAPALVFVHGSWTERIAARLQADGMRLDSIETALRRNDVCRLQTYTRWRVGQGREELDTPPVSLDFMLLPESPAPLQGILLADGDRVLVDPSLPFSDECREEAAADRYGIISLAPLVWQGDLPGVEHGDPMFVRDLGRADNERVRSAFPAREAYVFLIPAPGGAPRILAYEEGMDLLWGPSSAPGLGSPLTSPSTPEPSRPRRPSENSSTAGPHSPDVTGPRAPEGPGLRRSDSPGGCSPP